MYCSVLVGNWRCLGKARAQSLILWGSRVKEKDYLDTLLRILSTQNFKGLKLTFGLLLFGQKISLAIMQEKFSWDMTWDSHVRNVTKYSETVGVPYLRYDQLRQSRNDIMVNGDNQTASVCLQSLEVSYCLRSRGHKFVEGRIRYICKSRSLNKLHQILM